MLLSVLGRLVNPTLGLAAHGQTEELSQQEPPALQSPRSHSFPKGEAQALQGQPRAQGGRKSWLRCQHQALLRSPALWALLREQLVSGGTGKCSSCPPSPQHGGAAKQNFLTTELPLTTKPLLQQLSTSLLILASKFWPLSFLQAAPCPLGRNPPPKRGTGGTGSGQSWTPPRQSPLEIFTLTPQKDVHA